MRKGMYIVKEGFPFIFVAVFFTLLMWLLGLVLLAVFFALLSVFTIAFFRNPERSVPQDDFSIVAPADGKIIKIEMLTLEEGLIRGNYRMISIFMNVFNVHVNRIPCDGRVEAIKYHKGKFFSADLDKASILNERNYLVIESASGIKVMIVQIAGLIARRIVCWVNTGTNVEKGQRFGLIRFGSRLDVYLPEEVDVCVGLGQKVRAGETVLGVRK